jgi:hypothetical protein
VVAAAVGARTRTGMACSARPGWAQMVWAHMDGHRDSRVSTWLPFALLHQCGMNTVERIGHVGTAATPVIECQV